MGNPYLGTGPNRFNKNKCFLYIFYIFIIRRKVTELKQIVGQTASSWDYQESQILRMGCSNRTSFEGNRRGPYLWGLQIKRENTDYRTNQ